LVNDYPHDTTFSTITALTNRPLTPEIAQWSPSKKLQVVSGLDLLTEKGQEGLEAQMKEKVKSVETVTHVYFFGEKHLYPTRKHIYNRSAYIMDLDSDTEIAINVKLLDRAVKAIEQLSPKLKFIVLPTGTKVGFGFTPPPTS
jgi:hypothetical protein